MEEMRKEVIRLQHKVRDFIDAPAHGAAAALNREIQALEDDLQIGRNKYSVEDRLKSIIHVLDGAAREARIMNHEHLDMFKRHFEDLRNTVRGL